MVRDKGRVSPYAGAEKDEVFHIFNFRWQDHYQVRAYTWTAGPKQLASFDIQTAKSMGWLAAWVYKVKPWLAQLCNGHCRYLVHPLPPPSVERAFLLLPYPNLSLRFAPFHFVGYEKGTLRRSVTFSGAEGGEARLLPFKSLPSPMTP